MSLELHVLPLNGPLPSMTWRWDAETDILSGGFVVDLMGTGYTGTVELDDEDGSIIVLDIAGGALCGLDIVVCPDITVLPGLAVPAEARNGRLVASSRAPQHDVTAMEYDTTLAIVADPDERTWHLRIGTRRPVEPIRIADRFVIELDATQRLAGLWLEQVPPMPDPG